MHHSEIEINMKTKDEINYTNMNIATEGGERREKGKRKQLNRKQKRNYKTPHLDNRLPAGAGPAGLTDRYPPTWSDRIHIILRGLLFGPSLSELHFIDPPS